MVISRGVLNQPKQDVRSCQKKNGSSKSSWPERAANGSQARSAPPGSRRKPRGPDVCSSGGAAPLHEGQQGGPVNQPGTARDQDPGGVLGGGPRAGAADVLGGPKPDAGGGLASPGCSASPAVMEPAKFEDANTTECWRHAMDEELGWIHDNNTWELVDLPDNHEIIELKWIYMINKDAEEKC